MRVVIITSIPSTVVSYRLNILYAILRGLVSNQRHKGRFIFLALPTSNPTPSPWCVQQFPLKFRICAQNKICYWIFMEYIVIDREKFSDMKYHKQNIVTSILTFQGVHCYAKLCYLQGIADCKDSDTTWEFRMSNEILRFNCACSHCGLQEKIYKLYMRLCIFFMHQFLGFFCSHCITYIFISEINECQSSPCQNGGSCFNAIDEFSCNCPDEYVGTLCETRMYINCFLFFFS